MGRVKNPNESGYVKEKRMEGRQRQGMQESEAESDVKEKPMETLRGRHNQGMQTPRSKAELKRLAAKPDDYECVFPYVLKSPDGKSFEVNKC